MYKDTVQALSDAQVTTLVLVTRAERSALAEAARSSGIPDREQQRLPRLRDPQFTRRLLFALPEATQARQSHEQAHIRAVIQQLAPRTAIISWRTEPPVGPESLLNVAGGIRQHHRTSFLRDPWHIAAKNIR